MYGNSVQDVRNMPAIAQNLKPPSGTIFAANEPPKYYVPRLVGDLDALARIDLDREGLSEYKDQLQGFVGNFRGSHHHHIRHFSP